MRESLERSLAGFELELWRPVEATRRGRLGPPWRWLYKAQTLSVISIMVGTGELLPSPPEVLRGGRTTQKPENTHQMETMRDGPAVGQKGARRLSVVLRGIERRKGVLSVIPGSMKKQGRLSVVANHR